MTEPLPATAVVRVGRATFEPGRIDEFAALATTQSEYLVPAITALPGLLRFFTGVSPEGSMVQISVWDCLAHAKQLDDLREMAVVARGEMEAIGGTFIRPIVNYPLDWALDHGTVPTASLPAGAVVRFARGSFEPDRFAEVDALTRKQAEYLVPAIEALPGFVYWYSAVSPDGSMVNVSVWESDDAAAAMDRLPEMVETARGEFAALGALTFAPIVNYPIRWTI